MQSKKLFISLIPWLIFSVVINRHGANAGAFAALAAAALSLLFVVKDGADGGVKTVDVAGVGTFSAFAFLGFLGGRPVTDWIADYGRGTAALVLATIMLASAVTVPFTEQYARESVPREYWGSPVFRSINRRISALWGAVIAVMGLGHLLAGMIDPASNPTPGARPIELLLNWGLPVALVLFGIKYTQQITSADSGEPTSTRDPGYVTPSTWSARRDDTGR